MNKGFSVPLLSFAIAIRLWMSKDPMKEVEKGFKLNNYRKMKNEYEPTRVK